MKKKLVWPTAIGLGLLLASLPGLHQAAIAKQKPGKKISRTANAGLQRRPVKVFPLRYHANKARMVCARMSDRGFAAAAVASLDWEPGSELRERRRAIAPNGSMHARYVQYYRNVPVWGKQAIVSDQHGRLQAWGEIVEGLEQGVGDVMPAVHAAEALQLAKACARNQGLTPGQGDGVYENERAELVIYVDDARRAYLAYVVSFLSYLRTGRNPSRPFVIIDAKTKGVLKCWQGLALAQVGTGPGGNTNTGKYEYGTDLHFGYLDVVEPYGTTCTMETANVKTVNLNHGTGIGTAPAYSYPGPRNTYQEINRGYCPLNDAHFFGNLAWNMFWDWYGLKPSTSQMIIYVHFGNGYDGAFYSGDYIAVGDGSVNYYPLVCVDFIAHEVGHIFTENHSGLILENRQWGGMHEAFADMAGETAEYYQKQTNDFKAWPEIIQSNWNKDKALRYLDDPTRIPGAIDHFRDYHDGLNPHYSAGIFNKAFYTLATTSGWDTRKAFEIFVAANDHKWAPNETFYPGADAVREAAQDLGYNMADVEHAFQAVGIDLTKPYIQVTQPAADDTALAGYSIQWWDYYQGQAHISLYYDTNNSGQDGTQIAANIDAGTGADAYDWDTGSVPEGTYFIYASILDGLGNSHTAYSLGTVTVLHPDTYEPDNTWQQATSMTFGAIQEHHSIIPLGDEDWVKFDVQVVPNPVSIETSGVSGDTMIWLYDSSGTQELDSDDDGGGSSYFSKITYPITQPGTYYVKISDSGNADTIADYSISLQGSNPTPVTSPTQTPVLSVTPTATKTPVPPSATVTPTLTPTPRPLLPEGGWAVPNPFVPGPGRKIIFNFRVQDPAAPYSIRILNLRGALVRTLDNTNEWDGTSQKGQGCEGGVYIYQIESRNVRVNGQVVIVK